MKHICSNHPIPPLSSFYLKKLSTSNSAVQGLWLWGYQRKSVLGITTRLNAILSAKWISDPSDFLLAQTSMIIAFTTLVWNYALEKHSQVWDLNCSNCSLQQAWNWSCFMLQNGWDSKVILALEDGIYVQYRNWILLRFNCYMYAMFLLFNMYNCSNSGNLINSWIVTIFVFTLNFWLFFSYLVE